jgi:cytochrome b561
MHDRTTTRYTNTAVALHWLIFILVLSGFALALYMTGLKLSPQKLRYVSWHKWIGVTVFILALARLLWRLKHPAPALPPGMPAWEQHVAGATHVLLYMLLIVIPISGWAMSSAFGVPTVYLGVVALPDLVAKDKDFAELLRSAHVFLNYTMLVLVILHAVAALRHHFLLRDDVLARMLPAIKSPEKP